MSKNPKRPTDLNQRAKSIVEMATGEAEIENPREKDPAAVALGKKGGAKGGKARAENMTEGERSEAAKRAAEARWSEKD